MTTYLNITDERKVAYYEEVKGYRNNWEPKMIPIVRAVLDQQIKELSNQITSTNYRDENIVNVIGEGPIEKLFVTLYTSVGVFFARRQYRSLKSSVITMAVKEDLKDEEYEKWLESYVKMRLDKKIVSITGETRRQALKVIQSIINESLIEGWSTTETARKIRKALDGMIIINQWRAVRIARTETAAASNIGSYVAAQGFEKESGIRMHKYWIATYDQRTRDTHLVMEQQNPKEMNEPFLVAGVWPAECPMDPDLPPEESVNCRCIIAFRAVI
jgi:hypothetical protein